jgi:hypothetical protein
MGLARASSILPAALCVAWLWALGFGVWFQAVRPEVYALQGLVLLFTFERLVRVQASGGADPRPLYAAALALGLGLTFLKHGHYLNMSDPNNRVVACSFYKMANGAYWMNQDFASR